MMTAELEGFSDEVLEQAAKDIIRRRRNEYFPVLSDCLAACTDAKHWIEQASPRLKLKTAETADPKSIDRQNLADQLVMGEMGRQAAHEGWILALWKAESKGFDHALDQCRAGGWQQAIPLAALGTSILGKRQKLVDMVLHGVTK
jgi:hypothetical protein